MRQLTGLNGDDPVTQTTTPMNFHMVRRLLGLRQFAVADAAVLNRQRLSWIEVGYRDPTRGEDSALRRVLLRVAERRRQEVEAAIAWLKSDEPQVWEAGPRDSLAGILVGGSDSAGDSG